MWLQFLNKLVQHRFVRNWAMLMVSNFACQLLGVVATIRIARVLMPHGYGIFGLVQTMASLGTVFAGLGLRNVAIRECARHPDHGTEIFMKTTAIRMISLFVIAIGIVLYAQLFSSQLGFPFSVIAIVLLMGLLFWESVENIAFGRERMEYSAVINFIGSMIWLITAWAVPPNWVTPINVTLAFAVLQIFKALGYLLASYYSRWLFSVSPQTTSGALACRDLFIQGLPFYWLAILTSVITQLPIFFLAERSGKAEVGLYNAAFRLVRPMQMMLSTLLVALYPGLSRAGINNPERFMRMLQRALYSIVLMGTLVAMNVSFFRRELVSLLFGSNYLDAASALAYQCWYFVLWSIYSLIGTNLAARDQQTLLAKLSTAYVILTIPVLWWGAGHGATGLAMANMVGTILNMPYHWIFFQRSLHFPLSKGVAFRMCAMIGIAMGASVIMPRDFPLIWRGVLGVTLLGFLGVRIRKEILLREVSLTLKE